ncbi:uncharacterized protein PV09_01994 [Verruconis gallopava]|uniref:Uncharacterized protein n=1 Tax=Verruconis gallopava TaxID=253628 RepID=A0A0D1XWH7_9PEZI|nr:uncharacterized protein PV09_01994 [Verruconis gallopava]KIW07121.1 hypothetical protein PV09_01994 [Verruconis gallopava]
MAPTRRYLRITKYSVLECRVYMDGDPALVDSWLLRKSEPALPRVIDAVREVVLPKLREENERAKVRTKGKKKGAIKDVIRRDDFEVSIFLRDQTSRHALLVKKKEFSEKPKLKSNSNRLTSWLSGGNAHEPIDVDTSAAPILTEDDDNVDLHAVPAAFGDADDEDAVTIPSEGNDPDDSLFVSKKDNAITVDDNKKLGMKIQYDGFHIYGKILCLIVKRTNIPSALKTSTPDQALMENWVSTQAAQEMGNDDEQG